MSVEAATIVHPGTTTDARGNTVHDWSDGAVTRTTVKGCAWAPGYSPEDRDAGRQGVLIDGILYLLSKTMVAPIDRVELRGETYEIDGEPGVWRHPTSGAERGIELRLRRTIG